MNFPVSKVPTLSGTITFVDHVTKNIPREISAHTGDDAQILR